MKTLANPRDKEELLRRLRTLRTDAVRQWGRMSAHQMICHLSDSLLAVTGRKNVTCRITLSSRTIVKWIALYLPVRWPEGIVTPSEIDQQAGGMKPTTFAADVAQLEALMEEVSVPNARVPWTIHPIFGRMSDAAWMRWAYLHTDHHLRQFGA